MRPNPVLKKMGFQDTDKVLIIHADDVGMCQSTLPAFQELSAFGLVTSGAVMVPCGWYPAAARMCREHPEYDMGVHITLTSEWDAYRWGPVSTRDPSTGMMDEEGFFYRKTSAAQEHIDPDSGRIEMEMQIDRALKAGIKATHIDTHMGTVLHPKLLLSYAQAGIAKGLPPLALRLDEAGWQAMGADVESAKAATAFTEQLESMDIPLHDGMFWVDLDKPTDRLGAYKKVLEKLPAGLSRLYIHPAVETEELRTICPDWKCRVGDMQTFLNNEMKAWIKKLGIQLIGYREVQKVMPRV